MDRSDWVLLVTTLGDGTPMTPVQLQKSVFLAGRLLPSAQAQKDFYTFEPYNYGPFCAAIYRDAEALAGQGLLNISVSPSGGWRQYCATPSGRAKAEEMQKTLPPEEAEYLKRLVDWVRSVPFAQLLRTIYERWPDYKVNSIFAG